MLKPIKSSSLEAPNARFAIVAAEYNRRYVDAMLQAARKELNRAGAAAVTVVRVPGAFEIPVVAARLARSRQPGFDAVICLAVIIRGETMHAELIGAGVTGELARLQIEAGRPIVHAVLLLDDEAQARERCLGREHNRGLEAAHTAIKMAEVMAQLSDSHGF
jgi:6,7-dimethyl-8-ribityllumazine synthase